jgi:hypothetical protein
MFFKQNADLKFQKKILKARYARAATQQAATRRNPMLVQLFQAGIRGTHAHYTHTTLLTALQVLQVLRRQTLQTGNCTPSAPRRTGDAYRINS